ncbi:unnamed protein product [Schistosoma rodhaini]|nr:unnamed protein product [Schistosoma rodhaini]
MDFKNPWEDFIFDQTVDNINESSDCFNNIKLSNFPFLKSQLSSIDYLIKCEICNVMLLPESISLHYDDRHSEPSKFVSSAVLPYEAVSWCECQAEIDSKKDRTSKRTKVAPLKRPKRSTPNSLDATPYSVKVSISKTVITCGEVEKTSHEELREPVLLKLAKSDGKISQSEEVSKKPLKKPTESKPNERSVWSVVCPREHSSGNFYELTSKGQVEESRHLGKDMFECRSSFNHSNDSGIGSHANSVFRSSSYPPTPSLSPHLPSSSSSNVSDDTTFGFNQFRSEVANRPVSRSSHSSSSSGIGISDQHNTDSSITIPTTIFNVNSTKAVTSLPLSDMKSTSKCKVKCKLSTVCLRNNVPLGSTSSQPMFPGEALTKVHPSREAESAVYHLKNNRQEFDSKLVNSELRRNGFHSWITGERPTSSDATHKADNVRRLLAFQRLSTPRNQTILLQQAPRQIKSVHLAPSFISQYYQTENLEGNEASTSSDTNRFVQPNILIQPEKSSKLDVVNDGSSRINWPPESLISGPSGNMARSTGELQEFLEELEDTFDPLTQCGCLEMDDIKCKNSILCTVHTIEEKRRVPRQHDLRLLMREARKKQQILRQVPNTPCQQFPWAVQTSGSPNTVIDLTDEFSNNESFCETPGVLTYQTPRVPNHSQLLRHNTTFSAHDTQVRCPIYPNALNSNGPIDLRYVSNKLTARLHQRNKTVVIAQPCAIDIRPQTESFLSYSPQTASINSNLDMHHFQFNPMGSGTTQMGECFSESNTPNILMYPNRKQTTGYSSTSYSNTRLINEPQYVAQSHCLSNCQPAQPWANRLSCYPIEGSADTTINLDNLITNEDLCSEEHYNDSSHDINLLRKVNVPFVDETTNFGSIATSTTTTTATTLYPHLSLNTRKLQESQSRVVVSDMREKSITGRSRKTARTSFRSSGSTTVQGPTLTSLLHLRYQHQQPNQQQGQFQSISGLLGGGKINPNEHVSLRPTVISKTKPVTSATDVFNCKISSPSSTVFESQEKVDILNSVNPQLVYSPSLITPNIPCTYVGLSSNYPTSSTTFSSRLPNQVLDYCVENSLDTFYVPNSLQTCSNTVPSSISSYSLHSNSRLNNYVIQRNVQLNQPQTRTLFANSISSQTNESSPNLILSSSSSSSSTPTLPSNRYFVIRPSAIAQTPNLVVCAKRRDTYSTSNINRSSEDV